MFDGKVIAQLLVLIIITLVTAFNHHRPMCEFMFTSVGIFIMNTNRRQIAFSNDSDEKLEGKLQIAT